ncbi:unnamed protein product [Medioppia subpectinata]|uniref:EamA domain-containing protein n=1 Tax=Medioppia subpectinata TaxID=1979941 RepID=A0A7R9L2U3_9ACAR|nr:unnamed protein product [Medioppia subpectinata]CAG2114212.1 unnamed protein product [Medioppia subpectinata]
MSRKKFDIRRVPGVGIICAVISVIFWSTAGLCIKLSTDVHALEVLTISAIIQTVIYFLVMVYQKVNYLGECTERIPLFLRCTLGTVSMACLYTSYRLIPLSDATTIRFTAPVFVAAFAYLLLREPFGRMEILCACITITGCVLVGRPTFLWGSGTGLTTDTILGLALALSAAITIAISMTVMRKLQKTPAPVVIFWFSMETVCLGVVSLWVLDEYKWPSTGTVWLIIAMTGLCGASDQLFITLALKLENAGPVAVVRALSVVISFIFSVTILNEKILVTSFIGGALIFASIIVMGVYKWRTDYKCDEKAVVSDECCPENNNKTYTIGGLSVVQALPSIQSYRIYPSYMARPVDLSAPHILSYLDVRHVKAPESRQPV